MTDLVDERSAAAWQLFDLPVPAVEMSAWLTQGASIPDLLFEQAAKNPQKVALRTDDAELTYGELVNRASRLATWLSLQGVTLGSRVLIAGENSSALVVACLGALWVGAVEVVASPLLTARELSQIATDAGVSVALVDSDCRSRLPEWLSPGASCLDLDGPEFLRTLLDCQPSAPPQLPPASVASLQFTSGTTGTPKGAVLSHGNVVAYLRAVHVAWKWTSRDVLLHSLPLSHGHGRNGVYTALLAGATVIVLRRTDPSRIFQTLESDGVTILYGVPAIWDRLLDSEEFNAEHLSRLRLYTSGSAPLSPALANRIRAHLDKLPLERYGSTETGIIVSNTIDGGYDREAGVAGFPVPGAEVRVVDESGATLPDGEVGEIVARGPSIFQGYWKRSDELDFFPGGWYRSGDLGVFDPAARGALRIVGRTRDMIITGGLNVYPREVELVAAAFEGVKDAAVLGVASDRWGEEVVALLVAQDDFQPSAFEEWMRSQLGSYKVPKRHRLVSAIPRNHLGKVSRADLSELWDAGCLTQP